LLRAAYIGAIGERQAIRRTLAWPAATASLNYNNFMKINPP